MRILSDGPYSAEEAAEFTYKVYGNVITQMKAILQARAILKIDFASEKNHERAERVLATGAGGDSWSRKCVGRGVAQCVQSLHV